MSNAICDVLTKVELVTPEEAELLQHFQQLLPHQKEFVMQAMQAEIIRINARQAA